MDLTQAQKEMIFEDAKILVDKEIAENGYFDDTMTNHLEDIMLATTFVAFEKFGKNFDDFVNLRTLDNYDKIIDLTTDFLTWLFDNYSYDRGYYENMCYIRGRI